HLPFELLLQIFTYLPGHDIISLLSTCHSYYIFSRDETIWLELCTRYGVRDLAAAGFHNHTSHFTVYTELLHTYGPLLGLWASDRAFNGGIMEFRVVRESREVGWEGIVGEVWSYSTPSEVISADYTENVRIQILPPDYHHTRTTELEGAPPRVNSDGGADSDSEPVGDNSLIRSYWVARDSGNHQPTLIPSPSVPLRVDSPLAQTIRYCAYLPMPSPGFPIDERDSSANPPFPMVWCLDGWLSSSRRFSPREGRYYPIRSPKPLHRRRSVSSTSTSISETDDWTPASSQGLWLGSYGAHGIEMLSVIHNKNSLQAWKITGDVNVPRGAMSWQGFMDCPINSRTLSDDNDLGVSDIEALLDAMTEREETSVREKMKLFKGEGTISNVGFR
ncbi:hypothetical protein BXZ70DRAFT_894664, partial [Cristinia sonorae]